MSKSLQLYETEQGLSHELENLKDQYYNLFQFNSSLLCFIDQNIRIQSINQACCEFLKKQNFILLNKSFLNFLSFSSRVKFLNIINDVLKNGNKQSCEVEFFESKVSKFVSIECTPQKNGLVLLNLHDVTYTKELESKILQLKSSFSQTLNLLYNTVEALALLDKNLYFKIINPSFTNLFLNLFAKNVKIGDNLRFVIDDTNKYNEKILQACDKAFLDQECSVLLENNKQSAFSFFELRLKSFVDKYDQENLILHLCDNTNFLQAREKDLKEREKISKASKKSGLAALSAAISHEINQPLTTIHLYAQSCLFILKEKNKLKNLKSLIEQISKQAMHAAEIVHRTKNFMHKQTLFLEKNNINEVIQEALSLDQPNLSRINLKIQLKLRDNIPLIVIDKIKIIQIFLNLIRNAREAFELVNHPNPILIIESNFLEQEVFIHFHDNGPGIPTQYRDKVLNSYFSTKIQGTGLGLSICRSLIEAHRGKLILQDSDNEPGTWITCILPISRKNYATPLTD